MLESILGSVIGAASVVGSAIIGLRLWWRKERSKRTREEYKRKEDKYAKLIATLRGFYSSTEDYRLKSRFLDELNQCWLYCPDEVIRKAYGLLDMVQTGATATDEEKKNAAGEFILAIRKDLIGGQLLRETALKPSDFKHFTATR